MRVNFRRDAAICSGFGFCLCGRSRPGTFELREPITFDGGTERLIRTYVSARAVKAAKAEFPNGRVWRRCTSISARERERERPAPATGTDAATAPATQPSHLLSSPSLPPPPPPPRPSVRRLAFQHAARFSRSLASIASRDRKTTATAGCALFLVPFARTLIERTIDDRRIEDRVSRSLQIERRALDTLARGDRE